MSSFLVEQAEVKSPFESGYIHANIKQYLQIRVKDWLSF